MKCIIWLLLVGLLLASSIRAEVEIKKENKDLNNNGKPDRFLEHHFRDEVLTRTEMKSDADEDGKPEFTYIRLYQGGKVVYFESIDYRLNIAMRVFHRGASPILYEFDLDMDGHYEWILFKNSAEGTVLHRSKKGDTRLATPEEFREISPLAGDSK